MSRKTRKHQRNQSVNREQKTMSNPTINDIKAATAAAQNQAQQSPVSDQEPKAATQGNAGNPSGDGVIASLAVNAKQGAELLKKAEAQSGAALAKQAIASGERNATIAELSRAGAYLKKSAQMRAQNSVQIANFVSEVEMASEDDLLQMLADDGAFDQYDLSVELGNLAAISGDFSGNMLVLST
jgi:hypothetical protein